jgi:hypothetical protein
MARWAGWGAGPAGAGATGGPSRVFLVCAFAGCATVTGFLARDARWLEAALTAVCTAYFALRSFAGLGRPKE